MTEFVGISDLKFEHSTLCLHRVHSTTSCGWTKTEPTEHLHRPFATSLSEDKLNEINYYRCMGKMSKQCSQLCNVNEKHTQDQTRQATYV